MPERSAALFRDPVIFVLVLLLKALGGDFIRPSLKALLQDCVLVFTYMNVQGP